MFMFDVETLGVESTAAILSVAIIPFELHDEFPTLNLNAKYDSYLDRAFFVKFHVGEQIKKYNRSITKSTMDWWNTQNDHPRKKSFVINPQLDVSTEEGIWRIHDFCFKEERDPKILKHSVFWQRGGLDQVTFDSLMRSIGKEPIIPYNCWYDVRTAINLTKKASSGYCTIPGFDTTKVIKHDPIHDCAYDIMMLIHGEEPV